MAGAQSITAAEVITLVCDVGWRIWLGRRSCTSRRAMFVGLATEKLCSCGRKPV